MAFQKARGNARNTGAPGPTPAPTKKDLTAEQARSTSYGRENYGANGYDGPASVAPGKTITSPLGDSLVAGDDVLKAVIAKGTRTESLAPFDSVQDKPGVVSAKPLPTTHGMHDRSKDGNKTIPGTLVSDQQDPVRKA